MRNYQRHTVENSANYKMVSTLCRSHLPFTADATKANNFVREKKSIEFRAQHDKLCGFAKVFSQHVVGQYAVYNRSDHIGNRKKERQNFKMRKLTESSRRETKTEQTTQTIKSSVFIRKNIY